MNVVARVSALIAVFLLCASSAYADETTFGVTINGTTGHHIEPYQTEPIPFLPLPMFELEHSHKNWRVRIEGMPPIGPVPLVQSDVFARAQDPRVSYLDGEVSFALPNAPVELGVGETIFNQQTTYTHPSAVASSRVVGMRFVARAALYAAGSNRLNLSVAVNPSMHGLQDGAIGEYASLVDSSLRWSADEGRYGIVYGVRYLNYTAAYSFNNSLADRNHLFMPFVGFDWYGKRTLTHSASATVADPPALTLERARPNATSIGVTLLGTNGNRTWTGAVSATPLSFSLQPDMTLDRTMGRYEIATETILPNAGADPFAAPLQRWSYLSADALGWSRDARFAIGVGETVSNLQPAKAQRDFTAHTRSEALALVGRAVVMQNGRGRLEARFRLSPYVHVTGFTSYSFPGQPQRSFTSYAHGARVDFALAQTQRVGRFDFDYGLRYINQTTNYGGIGSFGVELTRSTSLMPFVGIAIRR